ncbi:hypothetical protein L1278_003758 [Pontibacter sp. HSC-36F09]|nr:hypothetical protein [Pontibacter sp. HSC-36F09]
MNVPMTSSGFETIKILKEQLICDLSVGFRCSSFLVQGS